ncbi:hypothetical protein [Methanococcus vannielii]|uniref:hypothetical protein n=1 Tax=Methanococcus vannielii TaxID=2187 RepID=UPI00032659F4
MVSKKVDFEPKSDNVSKISDNLKKSLKSTLKVSKRIIILMAITTFIVIFLSKNGVFDHVSVLISPFTRFFNLDPNVGILIMTCLFNVQAAMIMSSNLLKEGVLNSKEVIVGLIFANVLSLSTRYAKHSLPLHVSLFGPKLGTKIVMINAVITLLLDILIIGAIIFLI